MNLGQLWDCGTLCSPLEFSSLVGAQCCAKMQGVERFKSFGVGSKRSLIFIFSLHWSSVRLLIG